ncbi:MAG: hypothetical protein KJ583_04720 [Nanoarchaeota archaeon]|nr:hypothetical protein [Nanoarchaeota archaeon]MBU1270230.1 hypothetical protein [Nanoarchaeota archaeon]MBU1604594.1 hypothetical protein [Nanoarchaeota archaeon]MBU2443729.1 hypothetical protein [Nanoarchaeota archaeon]
MVEADRKRAWLENLASLRTKKEKELNEFEEKKKKELQELEEKKKKELQEAEEILKSEMQGVDTDEEIQILKTFKKRSDSEEKPEKSLEETIIEQKVSKEAQEQAASGGYGAPIESILASPNAVYERSDLYGELKNTLEKIQQGQYLSQQEREKFYQIQQEFNKADEFNEDKFGYLQRSKEVIQSVYQSLHQTSYQKKDDH